MLGISPSADKPGIYARREEKYGLSRDREEKEGGRGQGRAGHLHRQQEGEREPEVQPGGDGLYRRGRDRAETGGYGEAVSRPGDGEDRAEEKQ